MTGLGAFFSAFGGLQFLSPLALWAFLAVPLLWWLLRLTPPAPKRLVFPALILLRDLPPLAQSPAHTPWWLLLLRLLILSLLFLGLARPILTPNAQLSGQGPLILLIDNSWAAGDVWPQWQASFMSLCRQAEREQRDVYVVPTAPTERSGVLTPIGPAPALTTCPSLTKLQPHPWPADHDAALKLLTEAQRQQTTFWYNDGLRSAGTEALHAALQRSGTLTLYREEKPRYLLQAAPLSGATLRVNVSRADPSDAAAVLVTVLDKRRQTIGLTQGSFKPREKSLTLSFDLPGAIRNQAAQLVLQDNYNAGGVWLLDGGSARHSVGLIGDEVNRQDQPLLNGLHYLERALNERNDVSTGTVAKLLEGQVAVICNTNEKPLLAPEQSALVTWVEQGGVLIQFAGAALDQTAPLLPTPLRQNRRDLGGIFSWAKPQGMQPFPVNTPFAGLALPADVSVSQQLLADPAGLNGDSSWALLSDGTPLVTGAKRGQGLIALFHVPANPGWSNLPLSGLFVQMLQRLIVLASTGTIQSTGQLPLAPDLVLDGFGQLQPADVGATALTPEEQTAYRPGPEHPPGYYGQTAARRAFNLGQGIADILPFRPADSQKLAVPDSAQELRPWLLAAALLLLLADMVLALLLRGLLGGVLRLRLLALVVLVLLLSPQPATAATNPDILLSQNIWIGHITNGAGSRSDVAEAGLKKLAGRMKQKTAVDLIDVLPVNLEQDDLTLIPFLYWPLSDPPQLSANAQQKLQEFFSHGGMLLIDLTSDPEHNLTLRESGVPLPMLTPVKEDHPLYRTFYLLRDCPGRTSDDSFWSERDVSGRQDNVPAIFIGDRDWGSAWAGLGGESRQREMAMRCGVNLLMYALTGNYKMDQLHVDSILKRLNR
jgi:hypothetical protein